MEHQRELIAEIPYLRRVARAITRNQDAADDLVQDTLLRALQKGDQRREDSSLRPWLLRVLRNLHIDGLRRAAQRGLSVEISPEDASCPPRQELQVLLREVMTAMKSLGAGDLLFASALQYSYEEMAARKEVPVGTVRSRLSRARVHLARRLEGEAVNDSGGCGNRQGGPAFGNVA